MPRIPPLFVEAVTNEEDLVRVQMDPGLPESDAAVEDVTDGAVKGDVIEGAAGVAVAAAEDEAIGKEAFSGSVFPKTGNLNFENRSGRLSGSFGFEMVGFPERCGVDGCVPVVEQPKKGFDFRPGACFRERPLRASRTSPSLLTNTDPPNIACPNCDVD